MRIRERRGPATVVLGLGNPLAGDDGVGPAALERLALGWALPDEVELVDGGTWGMRLLPLIEAAERLIVLDAIDDGAAPGSTVVLERERLPMVLRPKLSVHQVDLAEVLALAQLRGRMPREICAFGVQPGRLDGRTALSAEVETALDVLAALVVERLARWGHDCRRRAAPTEPASTEAGRGVPAGETR